MLQKFTHPLFIKPMPGKYEVCFRCNGEGKHDCYEGGMTSLEFDEECRLDPDFKSDYLSGKYDQRCAMCKGDRVIIVPDLLAWPEAAIKALEQWEADGYAARQEASGEARWGC